MKHSDKIKLARKMPRTANDNKPPRYGMFGTEAWDARRAGIAGRVKKQQDAAHARAVDRKNAAQGIKPSLGKRALAAMRGVLRRQDERKRRAAAHARARERRTTAS
jgi:hypothetical protein